MFNGMAVYGALKSTHTLLEVSEYSGGSVCFETFPHAVTCAILGIGVADAKQKRDQRKGILNTQGISTVGLKSIDAIDAALCAFTARCLLRGEIRTYGDPAGGFIFVPKVS